MIDFRKFERFHYEPSPILAPKVYFQGEQNPYPIVNFSFQGLMIKGQTKYKRSDVLNIEVDIPLIGRIPMTIRVVWVDASEMERMGVEILKIPEEYQKIWTHFIKACHNFFKAKEEYQSLHSKANSE